VAHVELSLSDPLVAPGREGPAEPAGSLERWGRAAADAAEPCLVLDGTSKIVAVSRAACRLLGFADPEVAVGQRLSDGVVPLVDFASSPSALSGGDLEKSPPMLAYSSRRLARGLLRVQIGSQVHTVDAVATPLFDDDERVGSLTFFSQI
jgi:PAS domain-containing protein